MTLLYLVRHGEAAGGWTDDADPGLSDLGREQAHAMATATATLGPLPIVTSPLRRTRETAAPLEAIWGNAAGVEVAVGEIPTPHDLGLESRGPWLSEVLAAGWSNLGDELHAWRATVLDRLRAFEHDTLVVTHFVAINVAVGEATADDRVVSFRPGYCSVTTLRCDGATLELVERGADANTLVR